MGKWFHVCNMINIFVALVVIANALYLVLFTLVTSFYCGKRRKGDDGRGKERREGI